MLRMSSFHTITNTENKVLSISNHKCECNAVVDWDIKSEMACEIKAPSQPNELCSSI